MALINFGQDFFPLAPVWRIHPSVQLTLPLVVFLSPDLVHGSLYELFLSYDWELVWPASDLRGLDQVLELYGVFIR